MTHTVEIRLKDWRDEAGRFISAVSYTTDRTDGDYAICEDAFERFNIGNPDRDPVVAEYRGAEHRSLSVGDIVIVDGRPYVCASFGFDPVEVAA